MTNKKKKLLHRLEANGKMDRVIKNSLKQLPIEYLEKILVAREIYVAQGITAFNEWLANRSEFGNGGFTLSVTAYIMGLTRERVRQIEHNAIIKLRNPFYTKSLKHYKDMSAPLKY